MKRRFKLKIYGESPRSLLLAFVLANFKCDVYLFEFSVNKNSDKKNDQIFLCSNFLKSLMCKFDIWHEFEDISYGFNSLSIKDNLVFEKLLLRTEHLARKDVNTFGWTARYSDIKSLLIDKLINYDNIHFISKDQLIDESLIFDYEFNFSDHDKKLTTYKNINQKILFFDVYLRGNIEKRLYEINTTDGLLIIIPIKNNLYHIIWNISSTKIKESSFISKSFFLDNLTTLLPVDLKVDQIIGDINSIYTSNKSSCYLFKNKSIYFNEYKFKSNILYDIYFDFFIKNIFEIFNFLEKDESKNYLLIKKLGVYHLLRKYLLIINCSFYNTLIYIFTSNSVFSLFLRKFLFTLYKRINLLKNFIITNLLNLNIKI